MHGRHRDVTWTHLSSSAMAGDTTITVETNTGWLVGDQIVIAPSGWGVDEGEIRTIAAILGQGTRIYTDDTCMHLVNVYIHTYMIIFIQ